MDVPAPRWRKSSYSGGGGTTECVELADLDAAVGIRDSKNPSGPHLSVARRDLASIVGRIKFGELDLR
ncbi:DUF397 domain-containing protein [Spirillospora sp. NBC_01491]|nr:MULTISPECIES: DUF397 domain-containing protein [Thermomonosporaceae]MDL4771947.1 DUF397 domain-containing protein [Actinomadura xylanilytica]